MKFPVLALSSDGLTWLFRSEPEMKRVSAALVRMFRKTKDNLEFFDSAGASWALDAIEWGQRVPMWLRYWPSFRELEVEIRLKPLTQESLSKMKEILKRAVETDDDLLTQYHEKDEILTKLAATKTTGEVFRLYRWMMKDFMRGPNQPAPAQRP